MYYSNQKNLVSLQLPIRYKLKKSNLVIAFLLFILCFFIISFTLNGIGITWDEPIGYFYGAELIVKWGSEVVGHLKKGEIKRIFSKDFIDKYWELPTKKTAGIDHPNNHPPFSRYIQALFWLLFNHFFSDVICYRLSSAFLFSIIIALLFLLISENYNKTAAFFAVLSLVLMPRIFGHAHIAASDIPITAVWFLSIFFYWKALSSNKYILPFSIIYGLALITKFQAFIIPVPLIIYSILYERDKYKTLLKIALITIIVSPVVMLIMNPTWWYSPVQRIFYNHIILGINHTKNNPVPKYYFGKIYLYNKPWHMPLVMILITTPVSILFTFFLGAAHIIKNRFKDKLLVLFLINILVMLSIFILPQANSYDGVRHFLVIFPFVAGISGIGFKWISDLAIKWLSNLKFTYKIRHLGLKISLSLLILLLLNPLMEIAVIHPYELSYYNTLIGGIGGAFKKGMETTYWFDAVNDRFLDYVNRNLPLKSTIFIWPYNLPHFIYLQQKSYLRNDFTFTTRNFDYMILLIRQGTFLQWTWDIFHHFSPIYSTRLNNIPLVSIYEGADFKK